MMQMLRAKIYSDFLQMGQAKLPVDPSIYSVVQTKLADPQLCGGYTKTDTTPLPALPPQPKPPKTSKRSKRSSAPARAKTKSKLSRRHQRFEIESIQEESGRWGGHSRWFLVRWAGYQPDWEPYRVRGAPGTPVETWEPLRGVRATNALRDWEAAKRATEG